MKVDFPVDKRSEKLLQELESDEDVIAINSILLSKRGDDFSNYASIICFCFKEKDLMDLNSVTTMPDKVKIWEKKKMLENDSLFMTFFKHLFFCPNLNLIRHSCDAVEINQVFFFKAETYYGGVVREVISSLGEKN